MRRGTGHIAKQRLTDKVDPFEPYDEAHEHEHAMKDDETLVKPNVFKA